MSGRRGPNPEGGREFDHWIAFGLLTLAFLAVCGLYEYCGARG